MTSESLKIVQAFFHKDRALLTELESSPSSNRETLQAIQALRSFVEMDTSPDGYLLYDQTRRRIRTSLDAPTQDPSLFILLLGLEILFLLNHGLKEEALLLLNRLKNSCSSKTDSSLRAFIHSIDWRYLFFTGDYQQQIKTLDEGLSLVSPPGSPLWLLLKNHRIESALVNDDAATARVDLDEFKPFRHVTPFQGLAPYELMEAWYLDRMGKSAEILNLIEQIPEKQKKMIWGIYLRSKTTNLLKEERIEEAGRLLQEVRPTVLEESPATIFSRRFFTRFNFQNLCAQEALYRRDFDAAFALTQNLTSYPNAYGKQPAQWLLFNVEMARKQTRAARLILQSYDPAEKRRPVEWARLHLLEGDFEKAVELFKRAFLTRGEPYLRIHLLAAHEISSRLLGEILTRVWKAPKTHVLPSDSPLEQPSTPHAFLIGQSHAIQEIKANITKFAPIHATVLISGETGSGKDVVARLIHDTSPFAREPFIAINCGAMSDTLIESELFGYEKGAFTGANSSHRGLFLSAGKGTIFLDEISSMSSHLQSALLRVMEDEQVRPLGSNKSSRIEARIIAATNEPLEEMVQQKRFRKDLFYRMARLHIAIPPLRERLEDIPLLADYFLRKIFGNMDYEISPDLIKRLQEQEWPGNVRQLKNVIERFAYHSGNSKILTADLLDPDPPNPPRTFKTSPSPSPPLGESPFPPFINPYKADYQGNRVARILELLKTRKQITRLEIIRELQCSPNTATQDLRNLESKGVIRRIQPTTHLKSSYFVLAG